MADLGDRIKAARGALTQKEFAEKLGVDNTTLASWEIGRREPDLDSLTMIADLSGVSLDWLAGRYVCDIGKAKAYYDPRWRDIVDGATGNDITAKSVYSLLKAVIAIKTDKK